MTTISTPANARRAQLIKLIHVGRRDLERSGQMDEQTYRAMLRAASNGHADSTLEMTVPTLERALEQLKRAGFKVRAKATSKPGKADRSQAMSPEARKVRALWLFLHHLGAVRDPSERALAGYVKRMGKVDDLHWVRGLRWDLPEARDRMELIIESLKKWAMRFLPGAVATLFNEARETHRQKPFGPEQIDLLKKASGYLHRGEGFDMQWAAWECLMQALGRTISPELRVNAALEVKQ